MLVLFTEYGVKAKTSLSFLSFFFFWTFVIKITAFIFLESDFGSVKKKSHIKVITAFETLKFQL